MDIISRLKQYMDLMGIPVTQFADNCRIPRPTFSQLLSGRNKKVSDEIVKKIHEGYPDMSIMWLLFGEGRMLDASAGVGGGSSASVAPIQAPKPARIQNRESAPEGHIPMSGITVRPPQTQRIDFGDSDGGGHPLEGGADGSAGMDDPMSDQRESAREAYRPGFHYMAGSDIPGMGAGQREAIPDQEKPSGDERPERRLDDNRSDHMSASALQRKGKRVVSIVVYYDDNSFEPFIPDPKGLLPFQ